jgi:hypothetical protein
LVIGVLPTLATEIGAEEEEFGYIRVVIDSPTQAMFKADEVVRVR